MSPPVSTHSDIPRGASYHDKPRQLVSALVRIVKRRHVLVGDRATRRYRTGFRFGGGNVRAVVCPGSLLEQWRVLVECAAARATVITQASNTGLTGGSTPDGDDYDRDIVIVSTRRIRKIHLVDSGRQVICLGGTTLHQLERALKPLNREPHSVIGSSCIGASVIGGICNNSGGSLVRRGPAYTEMAVFAAIDSEGMPRLFNHLGVDLGDSPEKILTRLEAGAFSECDLEASVGAGSDHNYASHVREVDADSPARYNADPTRLFEASGSAGKVMVFGVRLDTFPAAEGAKVFYIGTNRPAELAEIRRHALSKFSELPIAGEYMHRHAFDVAEKYGKDMFLLIDNFGTDRLPTFFALKNRCDSLLEQLPFFPKNLTDRLLQSISRWCPSHLPGRLLEYRRRYEHHLMLKISAEGVPEAREFLSRQFAESSGSFFECSEDEGRKAFLHRFVAASAAVRYRDVHHKNVAGIVALDIALKRNEREWFEQLPADIERSIALKLYYGHFLCHVFHQDYVVHKGHDCVELEHRMLDLLDKRGAEYPAEHNVGHLYDAKPQLRAFYKQLDPCNCFNPGIGKTSKLFAYRDDNQAA
ncbi:D-lactate dehydrogenase [Burkholderia sp. SG-MS1]|uniref:D-lactate dehydrogenase n=1 Tax=Paraburkholderia sp. SG-MS1 TaxID=2023741 RepID=UPI0014457117|nr:D-lactate dehydrogenase [Paraburkholderia sp. SG-MS1]NKJ50689.1 D-lactate dehydrogenase [Paraburkholderia sp. SG-MS1]